MIFESISINFKLNELKKNAFLRKKKYHQDQ